MLAAFPSASGWGAAVTGGRNVSSAIRVVSNTNESGAGSFKTAVSTDGPAFIVFTTGGVCTLTGAMNVIGSDLYIAGQTARGGGFTFEGDYPINLQKNNLILRYLSLRGPRLTLRGGCYDVIVDHLSLCWGSDDMMDLWYNDADEIPADIANITAQNCLFAQGLSGHPTAFIAGGGVGGGPTGDALADHVHHISVHNSLFVNQGWRNPLLKCRHAEAINNVVWNMSSWGGGCGENDDAISDEPDFIANYYKDGNLGNAPTPIIHFPNHGSAKSSIYARNNVALGCNGGDITDPDADNWPLVQKSSDWTTENVDQKRSPWAQLSQPTYPVDEIGAVAAFARIPYWAGNIHRLESDGTWTLRRDTFDQGELDDIEADAGGISSLPATPGTTPTIAAGTAYTDTDGDGMPDEWELANGLDPNDPSDGPLIRENGYSNLEHFLNGIEYEQESPSPIVILGATATPSTSLSDNTEINEFWESYFRDIERAQNA